MKHQGTTQLETSRLYLRPYRMYDAEEMFINWLTDPEASKFWSWEPHKSIEETKAILKIWLERYNDPSYYHWVIVAKENMQAVGYIYLDDINDTNKSASVHYLMSRNYWNRGWMTEACHRVIQFAFDDIGMHLIHSWHHSGNPASGRVLQKCGMRFVKSAYRQTELPRLTGEYHYYEIKR